MPLFLNGAEVVALADAIGSAFPNMADLDRQLMRLGDLSANYSWDYPILRNNIILDKSARWELDVLVNAMLAGVPNHPGLKAAAARNVKHIALPEIEALSATIAEAYPRPSDLDAALMTGINKSIVDFGAPQIAPPVIRVEIVRYYNARGDAEKLIVMLLGNNPRNPKLLDFARRHGLIKDEYFGVKVGGLERMLDPQRGFTDVGRFMGRLTQIINCMCQIVIPDRDGYATGFLIGNQTILTNWHVGELITAANRKTIEVNFDYRTGPDGVTVATPSRHRLLDHDTDWLIHHSQYDPEDGKSNSKDVVLARTRPTDRLDYAVIRLAGSPGTAPAGANPAAGDPPRGFIPLRANASTDFDVAEAVFIFQHPYEAGSSRPLQLDWQKPGIIGLNQNQTRVLYDVNTRPGSSGSPCFNAELELIALHHAGGKDWPAGVPYLYNQGIPIGKIFTALQNAAIVIP